MESVQFVVLPGTPDSPISSLWVVPEVFPSPRLGYPLEGFFRSDRISSTTGVLTLNEPIQKEYRVKGVDTDTSGRFDPVSGSHGRSGCR